MKWWRPAAVLSSCCLAKSLTCVVLVVQTPEASKGAAADFRQQGLAADSALEAGFTAGQLLRAGYSTAELVHSRAPLDKLRAAGIRWVPMSPV